MRRVGFLHTASFFHLATLKDPAVKAADVVDLYGPDVVESDFDDIDALFVSARLHPVIRERVAPYVVRFLARDGVKVYIDGENSVGEWLPGTTETLCGTNFWAWRTGEDVGRRSVNTDHPFWRYLSEHSVHWHYHGLLEHPASAVPLVRLVDVPDPDGTQVSDDPWGQSYRAKPGHPNTLLYYDADTFGGEVVVSTMDSVYHHGSGFMPGATQLMYRMLRWLGE